MTNVRDYGATGDGRTDDAPAIQHAVEEGAGHLRFPRGVYRLGRSVVVDLARYGPLSISGEGGTARLLMDAPGPALKFVGSHDRTAHPEDFRAGVWERERMPSVRAIEVVGGHEQADGIELTGTMQATLDGVLIRRCRYGVHLVGRNRNLLLANCHIYHGRAGAIGVFFDGVNLHQANITGCHISYCRHAGIKVIASEVRNLQITGNDIEYNYDPENPDSADVWIDSRRGTVREGTIASNTIQARYSPSGANVRIEGPEEPGTSKGAGLWTIVGNVLQSQTVNLWLRWCRGVNVVGNSFASGAERSLLIEDARHIAVGPNTFDHNPDYEGDRRDGITIRRCAGIGLSGLMLERTHPDGPGRGGAITVEDSSDVVIVGCQVLDPIEQGVVLQGAQRVRIANCTIFDRGDGIVPRPAAIRVEPDCRDVLLAGNLVRGEILDSGSRANERDTHRPS